jgi:dipeptidyl aminopeptidase/acylaminoacyl peptidase
MVTGGMDQLALAIDRLDRLKFPSDITFEKEGRVLAAAVRPATREPRESYASRIWRYTLDGSASQITHGPNGDYTPRYSPVDSRLAFTSDRTIKGKADLFILNNGVAKPLGDIPGTVENLRWTSDGAAIVVLAADRGLDGGATNGAKRLSWGDEEDPAVDNPKTARRRLFKVDTTSGATTEVGPADLSVWEFDLIGAGESAVALVSDDPSERGWYHTRVIRIDFATRAVAVLHRSDWQLLSPSVSTSGKKVAFLEGWSSDRGLVASEIRILDLATGSLSTITASETSDVTTFQWLDEDSLWFAGWSKLGAIYGVVKTDGTVLWSRYEDAIVGSNSFSAQISPTPDKTGYATVRETAGEPPEIVFRQLSDSEWKPVTTLNGSIAAEFSDYPEVRSLRWKGTDGLELDGLVLLPRDRKPVPLPTIVDIHGGPSWAAKYAYNPGSALPYAAAGYAVFLPNYRGNTGWGQKFARLNIGDPGGAEFDDILAGIDRCVTDGLADPARLGVTGVSYGGYMTAWAVATSDRFKAAVMISGISNQLSSHYSCNHDFHGFINGGPLPDKRNIDVALDRSPLVRLDQPTTPTLLLHGAEDRCTPLGQAQEFYTALHERGAHSELVVYPREGHGFQEREHQLDAWRRAVGWFDHYLGLER